jgi:hypothetical protein
MEIKTNSIKMLNWLRTIGAVTMFDKIKMEL